MNMIKRYAMHSSPKAPMSNPGLWVNVQQTFVIDRGVWVEEHDGKQYLVVRSHPHRGSALANQWKSGQIPDWVNEQLIRHHERHSMAKKTQLSVQGSCVMVISEFRDFPKEGMTVIDFMSGESGPLQHALPDWAKHAQDVTSHHEFHDESLVLNPGSALQLLRF